MAPAQLLKSSSNLPITAVPKGTAVFLLNDTVSDTQKKQSLKYWIAFSAFLVYCPKTYTHIYMEAMNSLGTALRNSSVALKYAKEAIDTGMSLDLNSGINVEINSAGMVFASEDKNEGVAAFLEKRKPNFKNK